MTLENGKQTTESLIRKLGTEPPSATDRKRTKSWLVPLLGTTAGLILLSRLPTTSRWIHVPSFFPDFLWIAVIGIGSFWILSRLRFPEESFSGWVRFPIYSGLFWIVYSAGLFGWDLITGHEIGSHIGKCAWVILIASVLFSGSGLFLLRNGFPGKPVLTAATTAVFGLASANFCLKFFCGDQTSYHILFSHVTPSLILFFAGFFLFQKILKW
ncbi:DUF1109 domain-containing protein [Leptospira gomenensis]|uniref:DUF1109 domain-containing protein n=1 Tax=Leptospira gomenensis TaxID=2484974 RepID=A0A5F1YBZ9_9LEPT|nr:NrsF family protein [Leptospira gomenensis]TGK33704.1 DUF1109 domain-containing protein [Leptospira gomenensis]TGK35135.1 DUF1109 domain-containing protein [Leptospira gomenensis]TGK46361.1 DUF1109 domain-containing protein [Leptospira gomenensis]TGK61226.1 DUF1109 domain-containing protein [Leptospira gomenensis]